MKKIYNISTWESLISILDVPDINTLDSPYLCDISNKFYNLWNNPEQWEYLKIEAEKFLLGWDNMFDNWTVSERYLFDKGEKENMPDVPRSEEVPVRLAFCKYMLNKSKEYESQ